VPWCTITDGFDKDFDVDEWHGRNAFILGPVIAHIGGVPIEELLPALAAGLGAGLLLKLSSLALHVRRTASAPHRRAPQDRLDRDSPQPVRRIAE
jgi:hypothetical protein